MSHKCDLLKLRYHLLLRVKLVLLSVLVLVVAWNKIPHGTYSSEFSVVTTVTVNQCIDGSVVV